MSDVADFPSALCPVCGEAAQWEKGSRGGLLVSCASCGLDRAAADEVERRLGAPYFESVGEGRYRMTTPAAVFELDYLRRESHQLKGELLVRSDLPGAQTRNGVLSVSDVNFSSARVRSTHAKYLAERAQAKELDWTGWLEELAIQVLAAERAGQPSVLLSDLPKPEPLDALEVDGLPLLERHPMILFGDGGTAKSYLGLYVAGCLSGRGRKVGLFDWELCGEDHRDRLEKLFGSMPAIRYARCTRPLVYEADRLRRIVRDDELDYVVLDSVAFACDGPPEAAEVAGRYFQALRQLGTVGSLHIAHVSKSFDGADQKPFGSVFWHNGCRASWNVKLAEAVPDDQIISIALHNRKSNLAAKRPSIGFEFQFDRDRTRVSRVDVADIPDLAASLSVPERIRHLLRSGPRTRDEIRAHLEDVEASTLRQALHRATKKGHVLEFPQQDGSSRFSLPERRLQ